MHLSNSCYSVHTHTHTHTHTSPLQVQLPGYLKSLPLPKTLAGFAALNRAEWLELLPFFIFILILLYLVFSPFLNFVTRPKQPRPKINKKIKKNEPKVADKFNIEDLGDKAAFCRCWKSSKVSVRQARDRQTQCYPENCFHLM